MALSTGFDETKVLAALSGRIGWRNPTLSGYDIVDSSNQASSSGRYFNDGSFHAACTIPLIKDTQEDNEIEDAEFNTLLADLYRSIIVSSVNSVFDNTEVIESGLIFHRSPIGKTYTPQYIPNTGRFVGIRIQVAPKDFAVVIDSATILLDSDKTFNLHVYKDFKTEPLQTIEVNALANEEVSVSIGKVLNFLSSDNKGGAYYIGYYQDDLEDAQAIELSPYKSCFNAFGTTSIEAVTNATTGFDKFNYGMSGRSYGLNIEMSSFYDFTDIIIKGAHHFDEYIGLSMAAKVIEQALNNSRINGESVQGSMNLKALYEELNVEPANAPGMPVSPGLKSRLNKELKRLQRIFHQKEGAVSVSIC